MVSSADVVLFLQQRRDAGGFLLGIHALIAPVRR